MTDFEKNIYRFFSKTGLAYNKNFHKIIKRVRNN